ncbi:MAG: nicotinate-nucleotide adenylyltransferase [Bacteroidia bacterium]|nr:nicotinate-nucleotide adenylyltransferase [Bacteroidia bacterium]MBP9688936.1 nicotinate-nucleotide adenylyltransferase [Bacteroidia bacterium]
MKIGLFFGSFNPVHTGHLLIANYFVQFTQLDKIWFIVSPQNPFKANGTLLNETVRLDMLKLAINGDDRFKASDFEFNLPRPSYTVNTLAELQKAHPNYTFVPIIGGDNLQSFHLWKDYQTIINNHEIFVYRRVGFHENPLLANNDKIKIFEVPLLNISSTYIREMLQANKSIKYLVPDKVAEYIITNGLYKKA